MSRTILLAPVVALACLVGGCSDIYYDRRDSVSLQAGDAVEANKVVHIIDPWPRAAANRHIPADGQRMQRAAERYRTNKTTPLQTTSTSSAGYSSDGGGGGGGDSK